MRIEAGGHNTWDDVRSLMDDERLPCGPELSTLLASHPEQLQRMLTCYKFAARMIGGGKTVLDAGCGEGLGTWLLAKECGAAVGIDPDPDAIAWAQRNWPNDRISFFCRDIPEGPGKNVDAVVWILRGENPDRSAREYLGKLRRFLLPHGMVVLAAYGEKPDAALFSDLRREMEHAYIHTFPFGIWDNNLVPGKVSGADAAIILGCQPR